jgi:hypothetical protein
LLKRLAAAGAQRHPQQEGYHEPCAGIDRLVQSLSRVFFPDEGDTADEQ